MRVKRSTVALVIAFLATLALYLEVRPAPRPVPTAPAGTPAPAVPGVPGVPAPTSPTTARP